MNFEFLPAEVRKSLRRRAQPVWCNPMLATLTREPFSNPEWIFETKLDGIRCLAFQKGGSIDLFSRNHLRLNSNYPQLASAFIKQPARNFIVDGEIVALRRGV